MYRAKNEMLNQRHSRLPGASELKREQQTARDRSEQLRRATRDTAAYKKLNQENRRLQVLMRYKADPTLVAEQRKLGRMIWEMPHREIAKAKGAAMARTNPLEAQLLQKSYWSGSLAKLSKKMLDGHTPHIPDNVRQLETAKVLQSLPWPTTVDWDGRARYERDKKAMAQPVMQHYLKRMKPWMYK